VIDAGLAHGITNAGESKLSSKTKVNRICDAFLAALGNQVDTNLRNLVTAHVCKYPPDLDSGLQLVARLRGLYLNSLKKMPC
jgi:elongator complex protein 1